MLAGGADLYFSCRKGTCHSCILEVSSGDPGEDALRTLPDHLKAQGCFLPCLCTAPENVVARRPDPTLLATPAVLVERAEVAPGIWRLLLETETVWQWQAGQYLSVAAPSGAVRSYSITSRPDDYFLELHVRHYPGGAVSEWLVRDLPEGGALMLTGPAGRFHYRAEMAGRPLLLVANGTGGGVIRAIAADALLQGHAAPIHLVHVARDAGGHYLDAGLQELAAAHPNFTFAQVEGRGAQALAEVVTARGELYEHEVFLCGSPDGVEAARIAAVRSGAGFARLHSDPFLSPAPYAPRDREKIAALPPDPELWAALDHGPGLTRILEAFYTRVLADARLAPFFHKITKQRLVEKQFSFLSDLIRGRADYFGERPFNAHHWMVISDELFDYREEIFFEVVAAHGLPRHLAARWAAIHELFRREIVKAAPRGQWLDGTEHVKPAYESIALDLDTMCDTCFGEIPAGTTLRHHLRTGEVFCADCMTRGEGGRAAEVTAA